MIRRMTWLPEVICDNISDLYDTAQYLDGKETGSSNRNYKRNVEMSGNNHVASQALFEENWWTSGFAKRIFTKMISQPMFIKYSAEEELDGEKVGGFYAWHNDAPIMGGKQSSLRSDYVMVTGINDQSEYEGGGLQIRLGSETYEYRLSKGEAVFFDPTLWHAVKPVTKGERKVCVVWIETLIQDPWARELLLEYQDLETYCMNSIDRSKWEPDIDPQSYIQAIKYRIMRKYSSKFGVH